MNVDESEKLTASVQYAIEHDRAISIEGNRSKAFLGWPVEGETLSTLGHTGIIDYRPDELVITARAGTSLSDLDAVLRDENQVLACDPPRFGGKGTLGGAIAAGFSGPGRPWHGSVRDGLLGVELVNGLGERMQFGGQVMKNVAGYDVSRLMVGARGTLGLILSASLKVLPRPQCTRTVVEGVDGAEACRRSRQLLRKPYPVSGTCYVDNRLYVRLEGNEEAVVVASQTLGESLTVEGSFWDQVRDHEHSFFRKDRPLWRVSLARGAFGIPDNYPAQLVEWAGSQTWTYLDDDVSTMELGEGGYAMPFRNVAADLLKGRDVEDSYERRLKFAFDPRGIFNPGMVV